MTTSDITLLILGGTTLVLGLSQLLLHSRIRNLENLIRRGR